MFWNPRLRLLNHLRDAVRRFETQQILFPYIPSNAGLAVYLNLLHIGACKLFLFRFVSVVYCCRTTAPKLRSLKQPSYLFIILWIDLAMHDVLICHWAFGWMRLGHSIRGKFERRSLVKLLCKMGSECVDVNTLQSFWLVWEECKPVWLSYYIAVTCNSHHVEDTRHLINPPRTIPLPRVNG